MREEGDGAGLHEASKKPSNNRNKNKCDERMDGKIFAIAKMGERQNIYLSRLLLIAFYCIESRIDFVT